MNQIYGELYSKGSSLSTEVSFIIKSPNYTIEDSNFNILNEGDINRVIISNRLGNVERKITLENGSVFTTLDNDKVDKLLNKSSFIHKLESHIGLIFISLLLTIVITFSFFRWGIPWTSKLIAHSLPQSTNKLISLNTLDYLDKYIFEKTEIDLERRVEIEKHFQKKLAPLSNSIKYKLHFRLWKENSISIPNAMALPSGDIILTDKFIELSKNQNEIDAVLLHEMGHIVHRHTLEMLIESTFISSILMLTIGDVNILGDIGIGLGSLLVNSNYSRENETQADIYSLEKMLILQIDPKSLTMVLNRISIYMKDEFHIQDDKQSDKIFDYLSSHPTNQERIVIQEKYSKCFENGLKECN